MPSWVLESNNSRSKFTHSMVDGGGMLGYLKPEFPLNGSEIECPNCGYKATYSTRNTFIGSRWTLPFTDVLLLALSTRYRVIKVSGKLSTIPVGCKSWTRAFRLRALSKRSAKKPTAMSTSCFRLEERLKTVWRSSSRTDMPGQS